MARTKRSICVHLEPDHCIYHEIGTLPRLLSSCPRERDDALSARGKSHWSDELERDGIRLRTETTSEMWSDATHFHLAATLEAFQNDTRIHHRTLTDKIRRDLL